MKENLNLSPVIKEPLYFYRVSEFVSTFGMDEGKNEPLDHEEDFKVNDLLECKAKALKYYCERYAGLENTKYFLEFESPKNFEFGKHAVYSLILSLVEYYDEDNYILYPLLGVDEEEITESKETETMVLKDLGYLNS